MNRLVPARNRSLVAGLLLVALLLVAALAAAAGRTVWKSKTFKERDDKAWRLEVAIYMPRAPDVPHVPMKFEFQPEIYYERDMVDGDKVIERKVPLENRQPLIESVDVGFLDAGSGKIESRTRFTFKLTRAHGYEAGEYKVTIRDSRNDQMVGPATTLIFEGENEIIDRRAMVFGGEKKPKKDDAKKADGDDKGDKPKAEGDAEGDTKKGDDESAAESDKPADSSEKTADPAPGDEAGTIKQKPGGCGCRIEDSTQPGSVGPAWLALGLLGLMLARRRGRQGEPSVQVR